ncbi:MAG: hypothetical protein WA628_21050 [Terriglobales bacterium]
MAGVLASILPDGRDDRPNNLNEWDYVQLRRLLDQFVADGRVRKVPAFNPLYPGLDEEWFLDVETGDIYCLLVEDEKVSPVWEKVDVFDRRHAKEKEKDWRARMGEVPREPGYLAQIPRGRQDNATLQFIHFVLEKTLQDGTVERIDHTEPLLKPGTRAEWFKDNATGEIFGFCATPKQTNIGGNEFRE